MAQGQEQGCVLPTAAAEPSGPIISGEHARTPRHAATCHAMPRWLSCMVMVICMHAMVRSIAIIILLQLA